MTLVQLRKDLPALFFSAAGGGVSGWRIHFALLQPGTGKDLDDLFWSDMSVSNQSQHAWWKDSNISEAPMFLTADYIWGPGEGHYGAHRYIISVYAYYAETPGDEIFAYELRDRYMTFRTYDQDHADILTAEKPEIIKRLQRIKLGRASHQTPQ